MSAAATQPCPPPPSETVLRTIPAKEESKEGAGKGASEARIHPPGVVLVANHGQGRELRLPIQLLCNHSAFFADMFSVAAPDIILGAEDVSIPRVPVEQTGATLESLCDVLRGTVSHYTDFGGKDYIADLACVGEKYEMASVLSAAQRAATSETRYPLWQFALAARFGWRDLLRDAAERTLEYELEDNLTQDVLRHLSAGYLAKLLAYRKAYADAFIITLNDTNGPFRVENEARCPRKHVPNRTSQRTHDTAWPYLKRAMTIAVMRRPSGVSVLHDIKAVNAVKNAVCPHGDLIYTNWVQLENRIRKWCAKGPSASMYFD